MGISKKPYYMNCNGVILPAIFSVDAVRSAMDYEHQPGDLFLVTYPKCGTTWMQHIVMLILRDGKPFKDAMEFFLCTPTFELCGGDSVDLMPGPGIIKTHFPMNKMKMNSEAKYIFVARNPKDCCVSLYHHIKNVSYYRFEEGTFDEFFDLFIEGNVDYGDYFDFLLPWYYRRNEPNIYFTTYERLKKNIKEEILNIAKFIGDEHREKLEKHPQILQDVLYYSSFDYMKDHSNFRGLMEKLSEYIKQGIPVPSGLIAFQKKASEQRALKPRKGNFMRKGIVGDWKNHFTPEQEKRFEEKVKAKTSHCDIMELWKQ